MAVQYNGIVPHSHDDDVATDDFLTNFLRVETDGDTSQPVPELPYKVVIPEPGFCVKLKDSKDEKIFINVCHSSNVPEAKDLSDDELILLLESDDPSGFRIPMSVGEPHVEVDKNGCGCTAYDVIVNPKFYDKISNSQLFQTFFLTVSIEGLEAKYELSLKRDWVILKNRKFIGSLIRQNVRTKSKPLIQELDAVERLSENEGRGSDRGREPVTRRSESRGETPRYTITQDPETGHPEYLVAEVHLPLIKTVASLSLDVGEDRMLLTTRSDTYLLDVYLPYDFIQDQTLAQFNRKTKVLTVTLAVSPHTS